MTLLDIRVLLTGSRVHDDLPGPRSAEFPTRRERWESSDDDLFIDFLDGASVRSLGRAEQEQLIPNGAHGPAPSRFRPVAGVRAPGSRSSRR